MIEDDPFATPAARKAQAHTLGSELARLSVTELEALVGDLEAEIARVRAAIEAKRATQNAADALFRR
ncbi:Uncharacterized small protein, DUF1192 family [Pseudoxanthobacter soli DSM 19599]|uniref:Uncharacterized small protein, DUF1192 family n=1 Tax=Pseudoxanthobacter soli DSM 19599 TaxID=1123029 RepID=A0A1M7ZCL3_9HYPH|nr:DUF1192 domain-containing protein [Pseudoxanthobacter soli]SHO62624.1 Uncharacterized small protein, DUF1192 family [Pseudoxanthobacter soli DSM 19599]